MTAIAVIGHLRPSFYTHSVPPSLPTACASAFSFLFYIVLLLLLVAVVVVVVVVVLVHLPYCCLLGKH